MAGAMANLFAGNPMTTPVGQKIEEATVPTLASEDWGLNMEICDMINGSDDAAKDAARAIKKRLHHFSGKNYTSVMYTLTVLETCVKNCGRNFHHLICQKDYIQDLIKLIGPRVEFEAPAPDENGLLSSVNSTIMNFAETIESAMLGPRNEPPLAVQEKVLGLVRSWAVTFHGQPDLSGVTAVYDELLAKGVQFPDGGELSAAPIITPRRSAASPAPAPAQTPAPAPTPTPAPAPVRSPERQQARPLALTGDQADKLRTEIYVVDGNVHVFNEMLSTLKPNSAAEDDLQLLKLLAETCRAMQQRLVSLVGRVAQDDITAELLRLNDEINNSLIRYERFERGRAAGGAAGGSPERLPAGQREPPQGDGAAAAAATLIDLGDQSDAVSQQLAGLAVGGTSASQQLARIPAAAAAPLQPSRPATTTTTDNILQQEQDFDEMEKWLKNASGDEVRDAAAAVDGVLTNSEFDRFLAERAAAPEISPGPSGGQQQQQRQ